MPSRHQPEYWIRRLRKHFQSELSMSERTVDLYEPLMQVFLDYLAAHSRLSVKSRLRRTEEVHGVATAPVIAGAMGASRNILHPGDGHHIVPIRHL